MSSAPTSRAIRGWPAKNFHLRTGYRFRRPVHEELVYSGQEVTSECRDIVMTEVQDLSKGTRGQYLPLMEVNFIESNPIPVKAGMALMGLLEPVYRLPMVPPSPEHLARIEKVLQAAGLGSVTVAG